MIDEVLSGTTKVDGIPGGIDNGEEVDREEQPPVQQEEAPEQVEEEEPKSHRTRAANLPGIRGQPMKRRRLANDMAATLDRFCESTHRIEEWKLEAAMKMHEDNRKLELEMFTLTQASQERMASLFANVLQGRKISCGCLEIGCLQYSCLCYFDAIYEFYFASCFYCRIVKNSLLAFHGIYIIYKFSRKF